MRTDPLTGGLGLLAKRDGYLTGPQTASPRRIALDYLDSHRAAFGLGGGDLSGFELTRSYRSASGTTHLQWRQTYRGIPAFDEGLRANVSADGRLINIGGAPRPDLAVDSTTPRIGRAEALHVVAASASARVGPGVKRAGLVLFGEPGRVRLGWHVVLGVDSRRVFDAVVDASTGTLLYRNNLVREASLLAWDNYPGAPFGGAASLRAVPDAWLTSGSSLYGPNAWVVSDPNDEYFLTPSGPTPAPGDEIGPSSPGVWNHAQTLFPANPGQTCPSAGCSWRNGSSGSWPTNRQQAGTQLFFLVNRFHDYLRDAPGIGFGAASGNLEGADQLRAQVDVGANLAAGLPDCGHTNNAAMLVYPDGTPGLMLMFLFSASTPGCNEPGVYDVNGGDDAFIVDHEYTHALSQRLVTRPDGYGALDGLQSGAMGEGISDWYSMDFLVGAGLWPDSAAPGELRAGVYENIAVRTQPFDCPVGASAGVCPGAGAAGSGGYTYGDFGRIYGAPEVHADGEIWVETAWDLRTALIAAHGAADGVFRARALMTDGMRLSPDNPSFLDMRNAILQADVNRGFGDRDLIWSVFAARGMGVNARTTGDNDPNPVEDFTAPPRVQVAPPPDTTPAVISGFGMTNGRFRVGLDRTPKSAAAARRRRARVGSAFRFRLSEQARVVITIERKLSGRNVGKRCRAPSKRLRRHKRCTRYQKRGSLTRRNRRAGRNRIAFSGRIGVKALRVGRYRATVAATDPAGNRSKRRSTSFRIVRK